ncbi:Sec-independent protein translocase protein tatA/E-like protein [Desulfovibrio sp. X2]|uniref:twin-arginine translocase TatA/TatE family subunit n=1 Tax=Desulfovibrio sp. X2 TaxID=941449 RepID=UPI000358814E|nr:twin-arginine translocase TatA/TatE family subunit [Desulfovibrio sp. X2]EPR44493.1 Sec-independent protein translocase protein tatA/E-like protein [Desulfovibrio sp. X2]
MFFRVLQPEHLIVILGIALLVFGPSKLPQLGKSLGKAIRELKNSMNDDEPAAAPAPAAAVRPEPIQQAQAAETVQAASAQTVKE